MSKNYNYKDFETLYQKAVRRMDDFRKAPADLVSLKPDSKTWSVREIYQHLIQFNGIYLGQMEEALQNGKTIQAGSKNFKPRLPFRFFISMLEPPYKVRFKTIAPMYPNDHNEKDPVKCAGKLEMINYQILERIQEMSSEHVDTDKTKGTNPILKWVPMSLTEMLLITDAHQRRHIVQIEKTFEKLSGESY